MKIKNIIPFNIALALIFTGIFKDVSLANYNYYDTKEYMQFIEDKINESILKENI